MHCSDWAELGLVIVRPISCEPFTTLYLVTLYYTILYYTMLYYGSRNTNELRGGRRVILLKRSAVKLFLLDSVILPYDMTSEYFKMFRKWNTWADERIEL